MDTLSTPLQAAGATSANGGSPRQSPVSSHATKLGTSIVDGIRSYFSSDTDFASARKLLGLDEPNIAAIWKNDGFGSKSYFSSDPKPLPAQGFPAQNAPIADAFRADSVQRPGRIEMDQLDDGLNGSVINQEPAIAPPEKLSVVRNSHESYATGNRRQVDAALDEFFKDYDAAGQRGWPALNDRPRHAGINDDLLFEVGDNGDLRRIGDGADNALLDKADDSIARSLDLVDDADDADISLAQLLSRVDDADPESGLALKAPALDVLDTVDDAAKFRRPVGWKIAGTVLKVVGNLADVLGGTLGIVFSALDMKGAIRKGDAETITTSAFGMLGGAAGVSAGTIGSLNALGVSLPAVIATAAGPFFVTSAVIGLGVLIGTGIAQAARGYKESKETHQLRQEQSDAQLGEFQQLAEDGLMASDWEDKLEYARYAFMQYLAGDSSANRSDNSTMSRYNDYPWNISIWDAQPEEWEYFKNTKGEDGSSLNRLNKDLHRGPTKLPGMYTHATI